MTEEQGKVVQNQNPNNNNNNNKGKSCKGCLYYSSALKSKSRHPVCIGIPRTLHQVPSYYVGETELKASKDGRTLQDFEYGCIGYSVYLDNNDSSTDKPDNQAELPLFCLGIEVLARSPSTAGHIPAHVRKSEEITTKPQSRTNKPSGPSTFFGEEEYFNRFKRNAGLVASGVVKNVNKVGNYMKETLEDILSPYRRK